MATLLPAMAIVGAAMRLGTMTTPRVIMVTVIMVTATAVMVMVIAGAGAMATTVQGDMATTAGAIMTALAMATIVTVMATMEATMPYHLTMPPPMGPMGRWTAPAFR